MLIVCFLLHLLLLLLLSRFSRVRLCATPQMAARQSPPSLGFSRQEHWSGKREIKNVWHLQPFSSVWRPLAFLPVTLSVGRKSMTNLDSILKSKDITLLTKVHLIKVMLFPVVMYGCESWVIKKAEHWRIDAFENYGVGEDSWKSLGLQADPTSPS